MFRVLSVFELMGWPKGHKGCHRRAWNKLFARQTIDGLVKVSVFLFRLLLSGKGTGRIAAPHAMSRVLMNQNLSILFHCWECSFIYQLGSFTSFFISSMYFSISFCTYFCAFLPFLLGLANNITVSFLFCSE